MKKIVLLIFILFTLLFSCREDLKLNRVFKEADVYSLYYMFEGGLWESPFKSDYITLEDIPVHLRGMNFSEYKLISHMEFNQAIQSESNFIHDDRNRIFMEGRYNGQNELLSLTVFQDFRGSEGVVSYTLMYSSEGYLTEISKNGGSKSIYSINKEGATLRIIVTYSYGGQPETAGEMIYYYLLDDDNRLIDTAGAGFQKTIQSDGREEYELLIY